MELNTLLTDSRTINQSTHLIQHSRVISNFMHETICVRTVIYFNFQSFTNCSDTTWQLTMSFKCSLISETSSVLLKSPMDVALAPIALYL